MNAKSTFTCSIVRGWTLWYTAGLAPAIREGRRTEIESHLADHDADRRAAGWTSSRIGRERLLRTLAGTPADLRWRREVTLSDKPGRTVLAEWPSLAALVMAGFYVLFGLYLLGFEPLQEWPVLVLFERDEVPGTGIGASVVFVLAAVLVIGGAARLLDSSLAAIALCCAAAPAAPFFWMVLPTVLSGIVVTGAVLDLDRRSKLALER